MEQYSIEQRTPIVELYFPNQRSIVLTQRACRRYFNVRVGPSESTINRLVANFLVAKLGSKEPSWCGLLWCFIRKDNWSLFF